MTKNEVGLIKSIYVAREAGEQMTSLGWAWAEAGKGLVGDRYAMGKGAYPNTKIRHLTLITAEAIAEANYELELPFTEAETRRNVVTQGVELNCLVGKEFAIGSVVLRGTDLCDPCCRPEKLVGKPGFKHAFENRGGLRAEVLTGGALVVGHAIKLPDDYRLPPQKVI